MSGFRELADKEKFVVVWPQGTTHIPGGYPKPSWNAGPRYFQSKNGEDKLEYNVTFGPMQGGAAHYFAVDDVSFLTKLAREVADKHGIAVDRHVYWTGQSQGCSMALRLAAEAWEEVAAVACTGYHTSVDQATLDEYKNKDKKIPTLRVHGSFDHVIPLINVNYGDTYPYISVPSSEQDTATWQKNNGCGHEAAKNCWVPATIEGDRRSIGYQVTGSDGTSCNGGAGHAAMVTVPTAQHRPYRQLVEPGKYSHEGDNLPEGLLMPDTTSLMWGFMSRFPASEFLGASKTWHPQCEPLPTAIGYNFFIAGSSATFTGVRCDDLSLAAPLEDALTDVVGDALDKSKAGLVLEDLTVDRTQTKDCNFPFVATVRFGEFCTSKDCFEVMFNSPGYSKTISVVERGASRSFHFSCAYISSPLLAPANSRTSDSRCGRYRCQ